MKTYLDTKLFKLDNAIIVGCIPEPNEPKLSVNTFLKSFIGAMAWYPYKAGSDFGFTSVRCMLTSISVDIPASHRLCGFMSHNARTLMFKMRKKEFQ